MSTKVSCESVGTETGEVVEVTDSNNSASSLENERQDSSCHPQKVVIFIAWLFDPWRPWKQTNSLPLAYKENFGPVHLRPEWDFKTFFFCGRF